MISIRLFRYILAVAGTFLLIVQSAGRVALADENGGNPPIQECHHDETNCQAPPINLDLSSTAQSVTASHIASPVNIDVGGSTMAVTQGMALTPAQLIAAYQVARTGQQALLLGADGAAVGGSFILGNRLADHLSDLVIPAGVSVINRAVDLSLIGNLTNAGSIYAVSNNPAVTTANISALNILNNQTGLISTVLPTNLGLDLSQYSSVLNLSLSAINNIVNSGTIMSSGSLAVAAGGMIQNVLAAPGAISPVMQAASNLNLQAPQIINQGAIIAQLNSLNLLTDSLLNSGVLQAAAGNINISTLLGDALSVNNISGQILAGNDVLISTTPTTYSSPGVPLDFASIVAEGGLLSGNNISFTSPGGAVGVRAQEMRGAVHITGYSSAIGADAGDLNIASITLTGDPVYYLTGGGTLTIPDFDSAGVPTDFVALSEGSIDSSGTQIKTYGGNVTISAGFLFTTSGGPSPIACTNCSSFFSTTTTPSGFTGSILLSGVDIITDGNAGAAGTSGASPSAGGVGGNGGNITVQAESDISVASLSAVGGVGGAGGSGVGSGVNGGAGGAGGAGGIISFPAGTTFSAATYVFADGGGGGAGGDSGGGSGNGGTGGRGGDAGQILADDTLITFAASSGGISVIGGDGGFAGAGGSPSDGDSGNGGIITIKTINIQVTGDFCACSGFGANGNGGTITIQTSNPSDLLIGGDNGSNFINGQINAETDGSALGGTIDITANGSIEFAAGSYLSVGAASFTSGQGGTINIVANNSGNISFGDTATLYALGTDTGGQINVEAAGSITTTGAIYFAAQADSIPGANGGSILLKAPNGITIGSGSIALIDADGTANGGRIDLLSDGTISNAGEIQANGTTGGKIQISAYNPGSAPVNFVNDGTISATGTGGIIGVNGGNGNAISITGSGTLTGGQYVNVGYLDSTSLAIFNPYVVVDPFTGFFALGNISIAQGAIGNILQVSGSLVPPSPGPNGPSGGGNTPSSFPYNDLFYLLLLNREQAAQLASLNEQLGTRIATDYTPPILEFFLQFPLKGGIEVKELAATGEALFESGSFNAQVLNTLAQNGIEFGPTSGGSFFDLIKGYVLFLPQQDITVQTREGLVNVPKGSAVWIMETGNDVAIYDLHDRKGASVTVVANNRKLSLGPGKECLLSRNLNAGFETLNPGGQSIGYCNVNDQNLGGGIRAFTCEFSIVGGIASVPILRNLLQSNDPVQTKAAHKMLMNAAILSDLGGYKTPYRTKP